MKDNNMRNLASIQRILSISPIEGADKIEKVTILGWECVAKKNEFSVGDLVVYIEIDSITPDRPEFEFLRDRKFRVRTVKLRGQVSMGLCLPLSVLPNGKYKEGNDVTDILGITKYDPQLIEENNENNLENFKKHRIDYFMFRYKWYRKLMFKPKTKNWPSFISHTDETRIQNFPHICENKSLNLTVTEKLDGCLDENTLIDTQDGIKTIKEICETQYRGKVRTFNLETLKEEFKSIISHSIKNDISRQWYEIELYDGKKIKITGNHKVWIPNLMCWRRVDELDGDEEFLLRN